MISSALRAQSRHRAITRGRKLKLEKRLNMCVCVYLCLCLCPCLCLCLCVSVYVYVEIENWKTNSKCWNWRWIIKNIMKFAFKFWCKIDSKMSENLPNLDLQGWFGGPGRLLWRQDGPRCELDRIWGWIWRPLGAHLVARWPKLGQNGAKMALCWSTWSPRWSGWHHFGRHLGSYFGSWARS